MSQKVCTDLSKTSKIHRNDDMFSKGLEPFGKGGGKVIKINGKTYETKVLPSSRSISSINSKGHNYDKSIGYSPRSSAIAINNNFIPSNHISFTTSQMNYGSPIKLNPQINN